jgi:protein TonB
MPTFKNKKADLNSHYKKYFQISLIAALSVLIASFKFSPSSSKIQPIKDKGQDIFNIEDITNTKQPEKPQPPTKPQIPKLLIADVPDELELDDVEINENENLDAPPDRQSSGNIIYEDEENIFIVVEQEPKIVGGLESIHKNVYYTEIAKRIGIEGRVVIEIIVDKTGDVVQAEIVKGIFDELDLIALNAVKKAKFTPGLQRGKPVKVKMWIPIVFKLN